MLMGTSPVIWPASHSAVHHDEPPSRSRAPGGVDKPFDSAGARERHVQRGKPRVKDSSTASGSRAPQPPALSENRVRSRWPSNALTTTGAVARADGHRLR